MIGPNIPEHLLKKNNAEIDISLSDEEDQSIGPQIPNHLLQKKNSDEIDISEEFEDQDAIGPQIPNHLREKKVESTIVGPQIPQHILEKSKSHGSSNNNNNNESEIVISDLEDEDQDTIGPQIPKHVEKNNMVGPQIPDKIDQQQETDDADDFTPALPPDLLEQRQKQREQQQPTTGRRRRPAGPTFPTAFFSQDMDDDVVGPSLPKDYNPEADAKYSAILAIEERARQAKEAMEKKDSNKGKVERPEWMIVPPEVDYLKQANSSKSRQFSNRSVSKEDFDSSGWTDTPAEKERKLKEQLSGKRKAPEVEMNYSVADANLKRNIQEYNMHTRPMSLLEMHQQQKKKNKKSDAEDVTKRPFDREKDLLSSRPMDKKQKKKLLQQSNELGKSFGYGQSSFL